MTKTHYTIREVAQMFQMSESTLRGYCRKGILKPKRDAARNWRWFSEEDIQKIKQITQPR